MRCRIARRCECVCLLAPVWVVLVVDERGRESFLSPRAVRVSCDFFAFGAALAR